jgi:YbbR domain-containing protein
MKNLGLKVVSLLLACVVWFIVSAPRREPVRERIVTAPLSLVGIPSNLVITTDLPSTVAARVRGRTNDLRTLTTTSLEVPVDLSWAQQSGDIEITLRPQLINVPPEIEVVSIVPNKIHFRIEQLRQRAVPIRPFLVGDPPSGYLVGQASADPGSALVSGPATQILKLSEVATERIIMTGRTAAFVQNVAVVSDSPLVRVIAPLTTQVTVPVLAELGPNPQPAEPDPAGTTDTTDTTATEASTEKTGTQ